MKSKARPKKRASFRVTLVRRKKTRRTVVKKPVSKRRKRKAR